MATFLLLWLFLLSFVCLRCERSRVVLQLGLRRVGSQLLSEIIIHSLIKKQKRLRPEVEDYDDDKQTGNKGRNVSLEGRTTMTP